MHLFIEYEFLFEFESLSEREMLSVGYKCLDRIFREYTELVLYFDKDSDWLRTNSLYYDLITNYNLNLHVIGEFNSYFDRITEIPNQSLILTKTELIDTIKVQEMGALNFSIANFDVKIRRYIEDYEIEFDLSDMEKRFNWRDIGFISETPFKSVVIDDSYILIDEKNQRLNDNLIPLLNEILKKKSSKISLTIFTEKIQNGDERKFQLSEIQCVQKRYSYIESILSKSLGSLCIVKNSFFKDKFDEHDRFLYTPFCLISIGKGFNLFPVKTNNSTVYCSNIFKKSTYKKMNNHFNLLKDKTIRLNSSSFQVIPTNLKVYPDADQVRLYKD